MSEGRKYNTDALFIFPLVEDGDADFVTDYTPASGDAKIWTDLLISTTLSAETVAFTSGGTRQMIRGDTITGATSTETATVVAVVTTSGTWAGGNAVGFLFVKSATGAFQSENLNTGGQSNNCTIAGDLDGTLQPVSVGNGLFAVALTAAEMSCEVGSIHIIDSATKAIEDQAILFHTYGNTSALHAMDFDDAVRGGMTALPNANADAGGGLVISDAGGLDIDAKLANTNEVTVARMGALTDWEDGGRLDLLLDAIPTTTMRGTDNASTAADLLDKLGAVDESAAAGDPSATESVMQYVKQIVNVLEGSDGITTLKAAAAPASGVSLSEMIRAIYDDSDNIDTQVGTAGDGLTNITLANDLSATMKASVKTEVNAAIDTAISELGVAAPTATPTLRTGMMLMYMTLRNKLIVQTSGTDALEIHNNAGTKIASKLLTDDSADYIEAQMS